MPLAMPDAGRRGKPPSWRSAEYAAIGYRTLGGGQHGLIGGIRPVASTGR
jgi:hypothetical protein